MADTGSEHCLTTKPVSFHDMSLLKCTEIAPYRNFRLSSSILKHFLEFAEMLCCTTSGLFRSQSGQLAGKPRESQPVAETLPGREGLWVLPEQPTAIGYSPWQAQRYHSGPFKDGLAAQLRECWQQIPPASNTFRICLICRAHPTWVTPFRAGLFSGVRLHHSTQPGIAMLAPRYPPGCLRFCEAYIITHLLPLPSAAFSISFHKCSSLINSQSVSASALRDPGPQQC